MTKKLIFETIINKINVDNKVIFPVFSSIIIDEYL